MVMKMMKNEAVVLFFGEKYESPLVLNNIKRKDGKIVSGWVYNGNWDYIVRNGKIYCGYRNKEDYIRDLPEKITEIDVTDLYETTGDYNEIIWKARQSIPTN